MPSTRTRPAPFVVRLSASLLALSCALAVLPAVASAGTPTTVTVRVEGAGGQTLLPQTVVTTTAAPINVDNNPADDCSGTSAGGALYDAVQGDWGVSFDSGIGVSFNAIEGLDLGSSTDAYWAFWYDNAYASVGACAQELSPGDHVVFVASCYAVGPGCPTSSSPDQFLVEGAPNGASVAPGAAVPVEVNTPVSIPVSSISDASYGPDALPGVTVSAGSLSTQVSAPGAATLTFPSTGTYTVQAAATDAVPSDSYTVCVHNGNDGTCGTTAPQPAATTIGTTTTTTTSATSTAIGAVQGTSVTRAPAAALAAFAASILNSHVYSAADAPRSLAGHVTAPGALLEVRARLTRDDHGRCSAYDGTTERFRAARCGADRAPFFGVGKSPTFSYLLPTRLAPGRYVFDVEAVDAAGRVSGLYHGTSRIVFYVK